uniref:C-1-tetrahydrofolate synthase, cytoplasmic n=1 Tax=Rhabditophanes sp. KR3021 TaxID=114890 RepID=A0AC35UAU5_9BILA
MATLIDGKVISNQVCHNILTNLKAIQDQHPHFVPCLAIVQVGNREDSNCYIRNKIKKCTELGIRSKLIKLDDHTSQGQLEAKIEELNGEYEVDGIIVQLPLDSVHKIDADFCLDKIAIDKDVDGLTKVNAGRLMHGQLHNTIYPCTPYGCLYLVQKATGDVNYCSGKRVVVIGRSKIVGAPLASLFMWHDATVTVCHSKTRHIEQVCREADILVVAAGKTKMVKGSWIKKGAVVIDCGINVVEVDGKRKLFGDVDFDEAKEVASYITKVPGGVGPMTIAMLLNNTFNQAVKRRITESYGKSTTWQLDPLPLRLVEPVPCDIDVSRAQTPKKISLLAREIGIHEDEVELYGNNKAKVSLKLLERLEGRKDGKYVLVAGITPTSLGEGKSTTTMGLAQSLCVNLKKNSFACVRQPSLGPVFGTKGGASGGGYSQAIPMEEFNLHLTGDIHAITAANNLLAAAIDARMFHENTQSNVALFNRLVPKNKKGERLLSGIQKRRALRLELPDVGDVNEWSPENRAKFARIDIDPETISWNRVIDTNDRFLRGIEVGKAGTEKGMSRMTKFDITVASEIMAILALANDLADFKDKVSKIVVALDKKGAPVTCDDIGVTGAIAVLMKDTVRPTLMQTIEGTPVFVAGGPFANIAHGCSSITSDKLALKLIGEDGYVVTEAGFGFDLGGEKFFDIKCRHSGLKPNCVVLVATVRALKSHYGAEIVAGTALPFEYLNENLELLEKGCDSNLRKQIENAQHFGVPVVVCINKFSSDTQAELDMVVRKVNGFNAVGVISNHWAKGGAGAVDLAKAVIEACNKPSQFKFLYDLDCSIESKIRTIATKIYGAGDLDIKPKAQEKIERFEKLGYGKLPICMAKTQYSLSHDPKLKGAPTGFTLPILDINASVGAGFLFPVCGEIMKMPGLSTRPCYFDIDIDTDTNVIHGLF